MKIFRGERADPLKVDVSYAGTVLLTAAASAYTYMGCTTGEWDPVAQREEIRQGLARKEEQERQQRERMIDLMIRDSDFNKDGTLDGMEQRHLREDLSRSDI